VKIRYSRRASAELASIFDFLHQRSPSGATHVMTAIYAAIEFVRRNPYAAEATSFPEVRSKVVSRCRFKVFYRVIEAEDVIDIIHVRHTSRRAWSGADQ
jgi:toxin ParE1/3/4